MKQITFLQLLNQAAAMGANVGRRADGVPAFMAAQYDAQPEDARGTMLADMNDESTVTYGDEINALLMGSLNLSGSETDDFFTEAGAPPTIEEKVDALLKGGQVLEDLKAEVAAAEAKE